MPARLLADRCASAAQRGFVEEVRHAGGASPADADVDTTQRAPCGDYAGALTGIEAERQRSGISGLPLVEVPAMNATNPRFRDRLLRGRRLA